MPSDNFFQNIKNPHQYTINDKIIKYPSDYIHGLISNDVYDDVKEGDKRTFNVEDWQIIKICDDNDSNYFGAIYYNDQKKALILAHRGTIINIFNAFKHGMANTDIKGILNSQIVKPQAFNWIITYIAVSIAKDNTYHLSVTGHSLGAWHAELSVYFVSKDFDYPNISCVNFDSPGSYTTLKNMQSNLINHTNIDLRDLDITTYNSHPNLINSCNKHVGQLYRINTEFDKNSIFSVFEKFHKDSVIFRDLQSHSLSCILSEFDPKTGKFKVDKSTLMKDWPYIIYKYDQSQDNKLLNKFSENAIETIIETAIDSIGSFLPIPGIITKIAGKIFGRLPIFDDTIKNGFKHSIKTIASSIITSSDTGIQSIIDVIGAYSDKRINLTQLREIYLNDSIDLKIYILKESNLVQGYNLKNFNLEYRAHYSPEGNINGHLVFKSHILIKLYKYRNVTLSNQIKSKYGIDDNFLKELYEILDLYEIVKKTSHNGKIKYYVKSDTQLDFRDLNKIVQSYYNENSIIRILCNDKTIISHNEFHILKEQEKLGKNIEKSSLRYNLLGECELLIFHLIFYFYPNKICDEIFTEIEKSTILRLIEKNLVMIEQSYLSIDEKIYKKLLNHIDKENLKTKSSIFIINRYNEVFQRNSNKDDDFLFVLMNNEIEKFLDKHIFDTEINNQELPDVNLLMLFVRFGDHQFQNRNPNIAFVYFDKAFEVFKRSIDIIQTEITKDQIIEIKDFINHISMNSYIDSHIELCNRFMRVIENMQNQIIDLSNSNNVARNVNRGKSSYVEQEMIRSKNNNNQQQK